MKQSRRVLTDQTWNKLQAILPPAKVPFVGRPRSNDREVIEGILWVLRSGAPWRDMPLDLPSWSTCYHRFRRWAQRGIWDDLFSVLRTEDPDNEWHMIDSTVVRAHVHAAGKNSEEDDQALGRSRGGFSTKIHVKSDALGSPLKFCLTPGQRDDSTQAIKLLGEDHPDFLLADAGYDVDYFRAFLDEIGVCAVIRPSRRRTFPAFCDWSLYKARNVVERLIGKVKQWRRIATRYEKTAHMYLSAVILVASMIILRTNV